jgi:hypothetical protein
LLRDPDAQIAAARALGPLLSAAARPEILRIIRKLLRARDIYMPDLQRILQSVRLFEGYSGRWTISSISALSRTV